MSQNTDEYLYEVPITVSEAKPGLILAADIYTEEGNILIKRGTTLSDSKIQKLRMNGTESILIKSKEPYEGNKDTVRSKPNPFATVPVEKQPEFQEFAKNYDAGSVEIKKVIMAIGDGAEIKLNELFKLTDGIMSKLKRKSSVLTFLAAIKNTDEHTFTHSNNVSLLCNLFSHWLKLDEMSTLNLTTAGILHDIGKTKIPLEVLNKKGRLTDEEFETIKTHTVLGYNILKNHDIPQSIKLAALSHHEKINGRGYPIGMDETKIDTLAKIVSICDIYDAMTANRIYRPKLCPFEVIRTFERNVYGELDTAYLLVFLQNIATTYLDSPVRLSDGRVATVLFINKLNLSKPIVRLDTGDVLDLSHMDDLSIAEML